METNKTTKPYPAELREQAAEHGSQWSAIRSIAQRVGCNAETLRLWVRRSERDSGARPGFSTDERDRLKALERENRELRHANEILRRRSSAAVEARGAASSPSSSPPLEWMDWFNQRRVLEPIGDTPPAETDALFYAELETRAVAA